MKEQERRTELKVDLSKGEFVRMHILAEAYGTKKLAPVLSRGSELIEWLHDSVAARQSFSRIAEETGMGNPFFLNTEMVDIDAHEEKENMAIRLPLYTTKEDLIRLVKLKEKFQIEDMEDLLDLSMTCLEILLVAHRTGVSTDMQIQGKSFDMYDRVRRSFQR
ncbi:MAG TPA: hypothetical protein PKA38_04105 [Candidatus Levybacteria bacterium]|nr:hypothetical protein [Candidatus Levybacteria bacterium]